MKALKAIKRTFIGLGIAAFSLTAMAFTASQVGICVEQVITFDDGRTATVFYVQEGSHYALYSADNLLKFKPKDVYHIKASNFSIASDPQGQCYYRAESIQEVIDMANSVTANIKK